jgi:PhnB protein
MRIEVYLLFNGKAEEAINFYKSCFNGEISFLSRFSESKMPVADEVKNDIMHATLTVGESVIMVSDSTPEHRVQPGNNVQVSLGYDDIAKMETEFNKLVQGGTITLPLQDTFWGSRFGMLRDKFDICWMFSAALKK